MIIILIQTVHICLQDHYEKNLIMILTSKHNHEHIFIFIVTIKDIPEVVNRKQTMICRK